MSRKSVLDEHGVEHPDPTPVEIPTRLRMPQRQVDRIREMVRREMSQQASADGQETFEEADDFELPDEDWVSPYEEVFEPPVVLDKSVKKEDDVLARGNKATALVKEKSDEAESGSVADGKGGARDAAALDGKAGGKGGPA